MQIKKTVYLDRGEGGNNPNNHPEGKKNQFKRQTRETKTPHKTKGDKGVENTRFLMEKTPVGR